MDNEKVIEAVNKFAGYLASVYKFGFYEIDDLKQEAMVRAFQAMNNGTYDDSKDLDQYLFMTVKNHFKNIHRKYRQQNKPPCLTCPLYDPNFKSSLNQCSEYADKNDCQPFNEFINKYENRQSLLQPSDITSISDEDKNELVIDYNLLEDLAQTELYDYVDRNIAPLVRNDFLRMIAGVKLHPDNIRRVQLEVARVMIEGGFDCDLEFLQDFIEVENAKEDKTGTETD